MNDQQKSSSRRRFLRSAVALLGAVCTRRMLGAEDAKKGSPRPPIGLGFSLYGMKSLSLVEAVKACRKIGYDCTELPVMAGWPADSDKFSADQRQELKAVLADSGLRLSAVMENLPISGDEVKHRANLDRLKAATDIAKDVSTGGTPLVETILGGSAGKWEEVKQQFVERLGEWSRVLADAKVTLAIKAHISNAVQRPEQLTWLLKQVNSPWVVAAYDFSHFQLQKLRLNETLTELLPLSRFIHVKDSITMGDKWQFALPGEGTIDYVQLLKQVAASNYHGDVVVEVSGQVSSRPGYDPLAAAQQSYRHLAQAFEQAGVRRGS